MRVAYVVKRYPRLSETFIVNEILAHEAAGLEMRIVALRAPVDARFHSMLGEVQAPVTYLTPRRPKIRELWAAVRTVPHRRHGLEALPGVIASDPTDAYQAARLAEWIETEQIDHVHAHFATTTAAVARLACAATGVPYSVTAHAKDIFHESVEPARLRERLEDAAAVVTVSDYNVRYMAGICPAANITRVYNGLDLTKFEYRAPRQRAPVVLAVGRLVEKKGFEDLVRAFSILRADRPDARCEIIGDGPLRADLEAIACQLGGGVTFRGSVPRADVQRAIRRAAVFAAPCVTARDGDRDGLPTVLLEAMAMGTPCVATPVTGIPEAVVDGTTGIVVPERDPTELAGAITRILSDHRLGERYALAARRRIEAHFDASRTSAELRTTFSIPNGQARAGSAA